MNTAVKYTKREANAVSPLGLAYIGDGVYELLTREHIMALGNMPVNSLHHRVVAIVRASAQARAVEIIESTLSEEETAVFKRGRNAEANVPKHSEPADYHKATGLEALFGYLHLLGENERIYELYEQIYNSLGEV